MELTLPKDVLGSLPAPDSQGLVRANVSLKIMPGGKVQLVELNDQPLPVGDDAEAADPSAEPTADDANPMPSQDLPDLSAATSDIYKAGG